MNITQIFPQKTGGQSYDFSLTMQQLCKKNRLLN